VFQSGLLAPILQGYTLGRLHRLVRAALAHPSLMRKLRYLIGIFVACGLASQTCSIARAGCAADETPTYSDILGVKLSRDDNDLVHNFDPESKGTFEVTFWGAASARFPEGFPSIYVGRAHAPRRGTYESTTGSGLKTVVQMLERNRFFDLHLTDKQVTETPLDILWVRRCNVVTEFEAYRSAEFEPDNVRVLFDDIERYAESLTWVRKSSDEETAIGLFFGQGEPNRGAP
jgi:hypothetical protein